MSNKQNKTEMELSKLKMENESLKNELEILKQYYYSISNPSYLSKSYEALRNMFMKLKSPTMGGYPEIGDIKSVIEEALVEWRKDKRKLSSLQEETAKYWIDKMWGKN